MTALPEDLRARLTAELESVIALGKEFVLVYPDDLAAILAASSPEPVEDEAMVERVARALCEHDDREPEQLEPGDDPYMNNKPCIDGYNRKGDACHFFWRRYDGKARAALAATRRPREEGLCWAQS